MHRYLIAMLAWCTAAAAAAADLNVRRFGDDLFAAGDEVLIAEEIRGDVLAAGGDVTLDGSVRGDAVLAGGRVRIDGTVAEDVYASGGELRVGGRIDGSARVAGGQVEIENDAHIAGGATVAGGEIELAGRIGRYLQVGGGRVLLNGRVEGDVDVAAGELRVGPRAIIDGRLTYRGREPPRIDDGAQIRGGVEHLRGRAPASAIRTLFGWASFVWFAGWLLVGALLIVFVPALVSRVTTTLRTRTGSSLLTGVLVLVGAPIAITLLFVTLIGVPLALLALCVYLVLLGLGYIAAIATLADLLLSRRPSVAGSRGARVGSFLGVALLLYLLTALPFIGGFVSLGLVTFGAGALVQSTRGPRATASVPA